MVSLQVKCPLGFFFFCHTNQYVGSLFPNQGSNLCPLHWEHSLNHWTTRKSPFSLSKVAFLHSLFIDIIF